jgi:predicted ArsR family transcriptional regulator
MIRRSSLELKKEILKYLDKNGESSLKKLDMKLRSGFKSIKIQVKELEFFGTIQIIKQKKNPKTGRPSTSVKISEAGKKLIR